MTAVAMACYDSHAFTKLRRFMHDPRTAVRGNGGRCNMSMLDMALVAGVLLLAVLIVARKKR